MYETLLTETRDGVRVITLNRPEVLNAVNAQMGQDLLHVLREAERDVGVRCVLLAASGRGFCAGADLREQAPGQTSLGDLLRTRYNGIVQRLRTMEKPVVAAINGVAAGAGCNLALAADLRIASERASFIEVFTRVGLIPDSGGTWLLPRLVGLGRALELMFFADPVDAATAERWGLVNRVVPHDDLGPLALEWAVRLAGGPTRAYGLIKRGVNQALAAGFSEALEYEASLQEIAGRTEDHREGVAAFLAKRAPVYTGR
ncbi:MAG: 2-(1,2-epoxy-1,2-dihydrophenyl)acetyl-CoA isomerase [Bacillati bacterium ANGP1]|uniref:2-(1,2-epoxy-1,2-dihydrophenyl)acetyl-CoA isomerase n=1 Tax=Candidatus Segetimicrobium genomatis TaxID=2569760 RepID=A0A537JCK8_9BACT|nr:MAG: 2-(1,2-epoxy-1,2-dihydrophenyl)acetyl-CoA isomerase [Terrabacteria group bacterium ANGP1]